MKKTYISALLITCFTLNVQAADVATVNGKPVKQSLVDYIIKDATAAGKTIDDSARANIIDKLITNELLDQEAQKSGIDKKPDYLAKEELTLHELRVNAYIADYIKRNPIDDKDLEAEYEHQKTLFKGTDYKARHILVKTEDEAKEIIRQLAKSGDFASIAKAKSIDTGTRENGGDLGWFASGTMVKPFSDAVANLNKGAYTSNPIQTEFGWHVIKLEDTRVATAPSFESSKKELHNFLVRKQLDQLVSDLKAKAKIINNPMIQTEKQK
jgi:peptidyl-prolyl cis-trans isomerase C